MIKLATSIEQSKHLLDLGIDPDTADMFYLRIHGDTYDSNENVIPLTDNICQLEIEDQYRTFQKSSYPIEDTLPAWTLEALMSLFPVSDDRWNYHIFVGKTGIKEYRCVLLNGDWQSDRQFVAEDPITAAYTMLSFIIENNYLNK